MRASEFDMGYRNIGQDKLNQAHFSDTRKPSITLKNLNKLKKMRAARDLENHMRMDTLEIIYGTPAEEQGPGGL
jgi:hypothetical protein